MFKVIRRSKLAPNEVEMVIEAPHIAEKALAGQFVILRIDEFGERIPLTIVETEPEKGSIRLIFQVVGKSTAQLATIRTGEFIKDLVGPLGKATEIKNFGHVLLVGGGVGIAALFPIIKAMKKAGNRVTTVLGAKTADLVILARECQTYSDELIIMTDDGSLGESGVVTAAMEKIFQQQSIATAWAIGPSTMMKFCTLTAQKYDVPIYVSLNPIMIDGTGMCGGCRVTIADTIKFACVDGPEFLGAEVNWDEFINRMKQYQGEEVSTFKSYQKQVMNNG
ncbi:MAG: sulfide/dihydroorotate dehydrogenase-like FAD/NAD-binding protein [Enterococcus sp.]|uniref:sulfide/dihydroorotate dehydrogenase-like FAD/NAD-binding protein n=1 Tax=Enterococcus TaxID=1350 RepID=UPI002FC7A654